MTTNSPPLISVVILNYNGLDYLLKTVPPILRFAYPDMELVVVDNYSTDGSVEYLQSLSSPHLIIIRNKENAGYGKGKNLGVEKSSGEYVLLLDEDILIDEPNILHELLGLYKQLPSVGFISLLLKELTDQRDTKLYGGYISLFSVFSNPPLTINSLTGHNYHRAATPDGGGIFFKKSTFVSLGGYDISQPYYLDVGDLGLRAAIYGYHTYVYDGYPSCHLGTSRKKNKDGWLWKYGYHFSGLSRVMFKNYQLSNLLIAYPYFCIFCIMKTVFNLFRYKDLRVISRFLFSIRYFFINYRSLINERRNIQSGRVVPTDVFLKIKRPI